jgi:hypothetical protein
MWQSFLEFEEPFRGSLIIRDLVVVKLGLLVSQRERSGIVVLRQLSFKSLFVLVQVST